MARLTTLQCDVCDVEDVESLVVVSFDAQPQKEVCPVCLAKVAAILGIAE